MKDYIQIQKIANNITSQSRNWYNSHRKNTMERIREILKLKGKKNLRIMLIGLGNGNDIDIIELLKVSKEIWFVDIDDQTLRETLKPFLNENRVHILTEDASGAIQNIDFFRKSAYENPKYLSKGLQKLSVDLKNLNQFTNLNKQFDIIISQCVLSQIHWPIIQTVWDLTSIPWDLGQKYLHNRFSLEPIPELANVLCELTFAHLRWIENLLLSGGITIINTDIIWRGVLLYGTDVFNEEQYDKKVSLAKYGKSKTWEWTLDSDIKAVVKSTFLIKHKVER